MLKYQSVGDLYVESVLEIPGGFHNQVDTLRWHVGNSGVFGKSLESDYSVLGKTIKHMLAILGACGINLRQPYSPHTHLVVVSWFGGYLF